VRSAVCCLLPAAGCRCCGCGGGGGWCHWCCGGGWCVGVTRPPAQGGSAGAVDTALATPGYGHAAYLRHFVLCATLWSLPTAPSGIRALGLTHTGTGAPLTTERRTRSGSVPSVRFLCVGQTSTSFSAFTSSSHCHYCDSPARLFTSPVRRQPHSTSYFGSRTYSLSTRRSDLLPQERPRPQLVSVFTTDPSHRPHPPTAQHHGKASTGPPRPSASLRASQSLSTTWPRFASPAPWR
jgi:hypothetical protein